MLMFGRYLLYVVVLSLKSVSSVNHHRDLNYYDGSRGRMSENDEIQDEFFRMSRSRRTPCSPNLREKSSESQGVSCPSRQRDTCLGPRGESNGMGDVVHVPCTKWKSSARMVTAFRGKSTKCNARNRGAREFRNGKNDLNHAVRQNAQWYIQSSRAQKPYQGYMDQSFNSSISDNQDGWNKNQPLLDTWPDVPAMRQLGISKNSNAKGLLRKSQYGQSIQLAPESAEGKLKLKVQPLQSSNDPPRQETVQSERGQQFPAPIPGYYNIGPAQQSKYPQVPNQGPPKKDGLLLKPYEGNRLPMNSYNMSYDGPHHYGPQNPPGNIFNTSGRDGYPSPYPNMMPSEKTKTLPITEETRNGPWSPGALEVDVPPGQAHQPKLPQITTRLFDAVRIEKLPKAGQNSQSGYLQLGERQQHQLLKNQQESWKYRDGSPEQNNMAAPEPLASLQPLAMTPSLEKTTRSYQALGKLKKEQVKLTKPAKLSFSGSQARLPVEVQAVPAATYRGKSSNGKPNESPFLYAGSQSWLPGDAARINTEVQKPQYKGVERLWKAPQGMTDHQEHHCADGDMSHVLDPPVTMAANLYTNKAHKIASKLVSSQDVTYVPFRGVPPARNDEAFYDKNLRFHGKIDRPPPLNVKERKWYKVNRRLNEHDDGIPSVAEDVRGDVPVKQEHRHSRKCHHNRHHFNLRSSIKI